MPCPEALILDVFKQGDYLRMGLFGQGQVIPTLRRYSLVAVSFSELISLSADLIFVLNRPVKDRLSRLDQLKSLQKVGRLFWDYLLSRSVKEKLKNSQPCVLTLTLDEELIYLPWELIFDGSDFLCLKFSLGRIVRSKGDPTLLQYRDLAESLKMLILVDSLGDLKFAYAEGVNIKNQFIHKTRKVDVDFKSTNIDKNYVKKNICDYDIVHFAGHCEFNKKDFQKSGWVLSDGLFTTEDILKMGQSCSLPALVFSNACHSAQTNAGLIDPEYQQANYSMSSAFLCAGVRHYIGTIRKIEDNPSLIFAREFYAQLISGVNVGESLRLSKLKLIKEFELSSLYWVDYLLFGYPGFVFFKHGKRKERRYGGTVFYRKIALKSGMTISLVCAIFILMFLLPKLNPNKIYMFHNLQTEYRKGNNRSVVILAEKLVDKYQDFLAVYPVVADACQRLGDKDKALKYYFDYVLKSEKFNNRWHLIQAYVKLGWFYQLDGQYIKAQELYDKSIKLSRNICDKSSEAIVLRKLAVWYIDQGVFDRALDLLTKSLAINLEGQRSFENARNLACDYFAVGLVFMKKNDYPAAKEFYEKSRKIFERLKLKNELSRCYFGLGEIYFFEKEYNKVLDYYYKGIEIDKEQGNKVSLARGYNIMGELYIGMDDLAKAEEYFRISAKLAEESGSRMELAKVNYNLGLLYSRKGRKNLAREHWRKAQEIYRLVDLDKYREIRRQLLELDNN